ncbi:MAG: NADH-quinone oxidoreductase subunit J [Bacteroidota bacterium]
MTASEILFLIFGGFTSLSAVGIALTKNVVHAALFLVGVILSLACVFVLLNAEFLAIVHVLVYAGGVVVLLAFGIMLTKRPSDGSLLSGQGMMIPALLVILPLSYLLHLTIQSLDTASRVAESSEQQVRAIGVSFMTQHLLAFELIAFLLLVVLVGAAYLAKKSNEA